MWSYRKHFSEERKQTTEKVNNKKNLTLHALQAGRVPWGSDLPKIQLLSPQLLLLVHLLLFHETEGPWATGSDLDPADIRWEVDNKVQTQDSPKVA